MDLQTVFMQYPISIVDYQDKHQQVFAELNRKWIEKDFTLEPLDIEVMSDPRKHLIDPGGFVFIALLDNQPAGVVALKKTADHEFELTKMAVDETHRRKGLARALTLAALEKAKIVGAHKVILYSNTLQSAAIALYRRMGFMEIPLLENIYVRANIKMETALLPLTEDGRKQLVESYGQLHEKVTKALEKFPPSMWTWKPPSGKWSIRENIVHLLDSEVNSYIRCRRLIAEPGSKVLGYDQDTWAQKLKYNDQDTHAVLELLGALRKMSYLLVKNQPAEIWDHTIEHSENGTTTFLQWLMYYENHTHIGQMNRVYQEWLQHKNNEYK